MLNKKYTSKFTAIAKILVEREKDEFLAKASLEYLKPLIPETVIDRYGLIPIAGNLLNAGIANGNDDVLSKEDAIGVYKDFINRPLNLSHQRKFTCGHIVSAELTDFNDSYKLGGASQIITEEEALKKDVFNIAIGGVIYDIVVGDKLVDFLYETNDPESENYLLASLSLEIAFDEIAILSKSPEMTKGTIITDEKEIEKLKPYLKAYKSKKNKFPGNGMNPETGDRIYRICKGGVVAQAAGIVLRPAALVKGLLVLDDADTTEIDKEDETEGAASTPIVVNSSTAEEKPINNSSTIEKPCVKDNSNMKKITTIAELQAVKQEELKDVEFCVASLSEDISKAIKEANEKWTTQVAEKETVAVKAKEEAEAAKLQVQEVSKKVTELETKLQEAQAKETAKAKDEIFQVRMGAIDEKFELNDEQRKVVVAEIKDLDDAGYEVWNKKFELFAAKKTDKKKKMEDEDCEDGKCGTCAKCASDKKAKKTAKAELTEEDKAKAAQEALDNAEAEKAKKVATASATAKANKYEGLFKLGDGVIVE